jgi:hypothetical protein
MHTNKTKPVFVFIRVNSCPFVALFAFGDYAPTTPVNGLLALA